MLHGDTVHLFLPTSVVHLFVLLLLLLLLHSTPMRLPIPVHPGFPLSLQAWVLKGAAEALQRRWPPGTEAAGRLSRQPQLYPCWPRPRDRRGRRLACWNRLERYW